MQQLSQAAGSHRALQLTTHPKGSKLCEVSHRVLLPAAFCPGTSSRRLPNLCVLRPLAAV